MATRMLNVRLAPDDERLAQKLRARGISISDIVRRAIRAEAQHLAAKPVDTDSVLDDLIRLHPTPPGPAQARPDTRDRVAVREHIRQKLRARRR